MAKMKLEICESCGKMAHDFSTEDGFECVPPKDVLTFGPYTISKEYRNALYKEFPMYTTEEVVGSYLGHNPFFSSEGEWLSRGKKK
jgi:hypothetical protein